VLSAAKRIDRAAIMTNYRRSQVAGGCYFFTLALAERQATLLVDRIDLLRESIRTVRARNPFQIEAMVEPFILDWQLEGCASLRSAHPTASPERAWWRLRRPGRGRSRMC